MSCWYNNEDPEEVFKVLEQLGEGSYGSVYKAVHKPSAKIVAIKVVPIEHEATDLHELRKEIAILEKCSSPYIVQYNGSFLHEGEMWISMEFCDAGSALDLMEATKENLLENEIAAICASVVLGLSYLHEQNNIHRDLKAGNILLSYSGHAKLADFGVSAQLSNTISKRKTVIGTPFWMAPEVIQEVSYDGKADIWSLGITAIELADGNPPHSQMHPMRAIFLIPSRPPPTLKAPDDFSPEFNDFIKQCLCKNPENRPSAKDLLSHPFIKSHVAKLESSNGKGLPIIQELVDRSMSAIDTFRDGAENNDQDEGGSTIVGTSKRTDTMVDQDEAFLSGTMVRPVEPTNVPDDCCNYGTMVFNGKPDFLTNNDTSSYYGTMVFRGNDHGTMIKGSDTMITEQDDDSNEPSFMKYFQKPKPTLDELQNQLEQLRTTYEADKVALEEKFKRDSVTIQTQIDDYELVG